MPAVDQGQATPSVCWGRAPAHAVGPLALVLHDPAEPAEAGDMAEPVCGTPIRGLGGPSDGLTLEVGQVVPRNRLGPIGGPGRIAALKHAVGTAGGAPEHRAQTPEAMEQAADHRVSAL